MQNQSLVIINRASSIEEVHSEKFATLLGHVGFTIDSSARRTLVGAYHENLHDLPNNQLAMAISAKIESVEGNLLSAYILLQKAHREALLMNFDISNSGNVDTLAYIKYEYANLFYKINEFERAWDLFLEAKGLALDENLKLLVEYSLKIIASDNGVGISVDEVNSTLDELKEAGMLVPFILGKMRLGIQHKNNKNVKEALKEFAIAKKHALEIEYPYLYHNVMNSVGRVELSRGNLELAYQTFQEVYEETDSYYLSSIAIENMSVVNYYKNEYDTAINQCHEALATSIDHSIISRIPGQAIFLGDMYLKKIKAPQRAKYFYQTAFDYSLKYAEMGLPLRGQRMIAVNRYMEFVQQFPSISTGKTTDNDVFKFAIGKSWNDITDIFKLNLIIYHRQLHRKVAPMLDKMKLTLPQYNSKQNLLKKKGYTLPNMKFRNPKYEDPAYSLDLQDYIGRMKDKSWDAATKQFEVEVMTYLYSASNFNKSTLSKALDFSYSHTLLKMKELEIQSIKN